MSGKADLPQTLMPLLIKYGNVVMEIRATIRYQKVWIKLLSERLFIKNGPMN